MSSVNNIGTIQSSAQSFHKGEELSMATKLRLEALGIDPSSVQTEAQAHIIIAQAQATPRKNSSGNQQGGNSTRQELMYEAKTLAFKTGVNVSDRDSLDDILHKIEGVLNIMAQDETKSSKVEGYQSELKNIARRAAIAVNLQQNIFNEMHMLSISNRLILGLG